MPTNSGPDAGQDLPDTAADEADEAADKFAAGSQPDFGDAGPLQRSQDAIDQGQDAAREALKDALPDEQDGTSAS